MFGCSLIKKIFAVTFPLFCHLIIGGVQAATQSLDAPNNLSIVGEGTSGEPELANDPTGDFDLSGIPAMPSIPPKPAVISKGNTYFIDQDTGSNENTREQARNSTTAWKTIKYGIDQLQPGDTLIILAANDKYEMVYMNTFGEADNWIRIQGEENEPAVIDGFVLFENSRFLEISNLTLSPEKYGIQIRRKASDIYVHDVEIDGGGKAQYGLKIGEDVDDQNGVKRVYVENLNVHNTSGYGIILENGSSDIVFNRVDSWGSLNEDGFSGRSNPTESISPSVNQYFLNCRAYNNARDGFDVGAGGIQYMDGCQSFNNGKGGVQGNGFKLWGGIQPGGQVWLVNSQAYKNGLPGLEIKNISDVEIFLLNNTFYDNEKNGGGVEIRTVDYNGGSGGFYMGVPRIHLLYNRVFATGGPVMSLYNDDSEIITSLGNLYASDDANIGFCEVRNPDMDITSKVMMKDISGENLANCRYIAENPESESEFLTSVSANRIFIDPEGGDFTLIERQ